MNLLFLFTWHRQPRSLKRKGRNVYDSSRRHWWLGLFVFGVVVFLGSAVLAQMYFIQESFDQLEGIKETSVPQYQEQLVNDVLKLYEVRQARYNEIISGGAAPIVVDTATSMNLIATTTEEMP